MFLQAGSPAELRAYMAQYPDSRCIAGGTDITVSPSFNSIAVAFGISVGIGVLFGYLPARRAARLNPIEALRYD